jgi:hypothetical protein
MGFPLNLLDKDTLLGAKGHLIGGRTGALASISADNIIASVRNASSIELVVTRLEMAFTTTTFSSVLSGVAFGAYKVESFTASPTNGRGTDPVPVRKRSEDHSVLPAADVEIELANTGALTAGTPAAPTAADPFAYLNCSACVSGAAAAYSGHVIWEPKGLALSLRRDEGLMVLCQGAFPTSLAGRFWIGLEVHTP